MSYATTPTLSRASVHVNESVVRDAALTLIVGDVGGVLSAVVSALTDAETESVPRTTPVREAARTRRSDHEPGQLMRPEE
jgi:hypothetical protein